MSGPTVVADRPPSVPPISRPDDAKAFLKVAIEHLSLGDAKTACAAASEACHAAPNEPAAHYAYGEAWLALNLPARAEPAFAMALQLAPDWVEAWINYGIARYRQGQIEDAKKAMREALRRSPGHPAATANLGGFMRLTGESETAEALLRETVRRAPANTGARINLAADLLQQERATEALAVLGHATPPSTDPPLARHWHLQRSLALLQLRRLDEAQTALDAFDALGSCPAEFAPLRHWRLVLLANARSDPDGALLEAERMQSALANSGPKMVPEHRIMGHFDLAKFWSGRGYHALAFRHWNQGHALLRQTQNFSRADHAAFVDANIAAFDHARMTTGPRAENRDAAPVFIVGMPRSGTTLCEQILAAHRDVHGAGERTALARAFAALGGNRDRPASAHRVAALDAGTLDAAATHYRAGLHALAPEKTRIVDKMPGNFAYLGLAALMLPCAKIIRCARDPRDIGLSIFTFRFHGYHPYAHDLGDLGFAIAEHDRLMEYWKRLLPNMILTVRLSDWVTDFDGTLARVLAHLDLPPDPGCARFYEREGHVRTVSYAQVRRPVNARGLGRWRRYEVELAPLIAELDAAGALADWSDTAASQPDDLVERVP